MIRCKTCVMPSTRPDTAFVDGECSACIAYRQRPTIDWAARKAELVALLEKHRWRQHSRAPYDCIVPSSGGKDSHYQVLTLLELGARPLVVTASTCMLTPIGRRNIDNLARYADTIEVTPNRDVRAKLNRLGLEMVGDASWPQHASIWAIPFQVAIHRNIPLIFWGENSQDQYGGPPGTEEARQMTRRWTQELGGLNGLRPTDFIGVEGITEQDMRIYQMPTEEELGRIGVEAYFLGSFIPWDSHRNAEVAVAHGMDKQLPCDANWWDFENLDCAITALHCHGMYRKFGFGRLCAQLAVDVRYGRVSRDDALALIRERDGLFPWEYLGVKTDSIVERLGISEQKLFETLDAFTDWSLFNGQWEGRPLLKEFA